MLTRSNKLRNLHKPDDIEEKEAYHSTDGDKSTTEVSGDIERSGRIWGTLDLNLAEVSVSSKTTFHGEQFDNFIENNTVVHMSVTKDDIETLLTHMDRRKMS